MNIKKNAIFLLTYYIFLSDQKSRWKRRSVSSCSDTEFKMTVPGTIPSETLSHYSPFTGLVYIFNLIGKLYERFVRKRALVKYQSQSEVI